MKTQIDIKSALFGIGVGVLAMFALGAETSPSAIGRYQVTVGGNPSYAVIIDTQTGKAWGMEGATQNTLPKHAHGGIDIGDFFDAK